jgi:Tfp pilus assembly protein PilO
MRAASKRYGIITGVYLAACVAVMGLFYGTVLRPQNRQWDGLRQELTDLTQQFDQAQQCRTEQSRTRMQTQLAALRKSWQDFVVDPGRASALAFQIGQMANDLKVSEFSARRKDTQTREEMQGYKKIDESWLQIGFRGPFESFAQFLNRIERNQPAIFVEEFSLKRNQNPSVKPDAEVSLCYFVERPESIDARKEGGSPKPTQAKPVAQAP